MQLDPTFDRIEFVWVEEESNQRLDREAQIVYDHLQTLGVEARPFTQKWIHRRKLPITRATPVVGTIPSVHGALRQVGVEPPKSDDYPTTLRSYLHRQVTKSTLATLQNRESSNSIFVKPAGEQKKFTGRVIYGYQDLYLPPTISKRTEVWISEIVDWLTEYRVYVINGSVAAINHYDGDPTIQIELPVVLEAINRYRTAPSAYAIDFGVLSTGQTALIEVNDGYSLGAYGIDSESYTRLLFTRWNELTAESAFP